VISKMNSSRFIFEITHDFVRGEDDLDFLEAVFLFIERIGKDEIVTLKKGNSKELQLPFIHLICALASGHTLNIPNIEILDDPDDLDNIEEEEIVPLDAALQDAAEQDATRQEETDMATTTRRRPTPPRRAIPVPNRVIPATTGVWLLENGLVTHALTGNNKEILRVKRIKRSLSEVELKETTTCSICMNDVEEKTNIYELASCSHVFHQACLGPWILEKGNNTCPMCRRNVWKKETSTDESQV
jgi:hypothetical protein